MDDLSWSNGSVKSSCGRPLVCLSVWFTHTIQPDEARADWLSFAANPIGCGVVIPIEWRHKLHLTGCCCEEKNKLQEAGHYYQRSFDMQHEEYPSPSVVGWTTMILLVRLEICRSLLLDARLKRVCIKDPFECTSKLSYLFRYRYGFYIYGYLFLWLWLAYNPQNTIILGLWHHSY